MGRGGWGDAVEVVVFVVDHGAGEGLEGDGIFGGVVEGVVQHEDEGGVVLGGEAGGGGEDGGGLAFVVPDGESAPARALEEEEASAREVGGEGGGGEVGFADEDFVGVEDAAEVGGGGAGHGEGIEPGLVNGDDAAPDLDGEEGGEDGVAEEAWNTPPPAGAEGAARGTIGPGEPEGGEGGDEEEALVAHAAEIFDMEENENADGGDEEDDGGAETPADGGEQAGPDDEAQEGGGRSVAQ